MLYFFCVTSATSTFIFDLDGVIYRGDTPIPYAGDAINRLLSAGKKVYFLTNNSSKTRAEYRLKLKRLNDIDIPIENIITSAYATALYLQHLNAAGRSTFIIGEAGLVEELANVAGVTTITEPDSVPIEQIDYVVIGIDKQFSYDKLRYAHAAIVRGHAAFIATNRDATYPDELGETPGSGSLVIALATAVGREPRTIGKPELPAYEAILEAAGVSAADSVMVGDRLDTDIAIGRRAGAKTVLVLTGVSTREEAATCSPAMRPDIIIGDLRELK